MASKYVNEFQTGDRIRICGWEGIVKDIKKISIGYTKDGYPAHFGEKIVEYKNATYLTIHFDSPKEVGYQYQDGEYGGLDNIVAYGC